MEIPETAVPQNQQPIRTVSDASAFRSKAQARDSGAVVELPSGLFASIRRPSVTGMIKSGHIPSDLAAAMQNVAAKQSLQGEHMTKYLELMDLIAIHAFVSPKVRPNGSELAADEIFVGDIEDIDKQFVMNYVQSGVTDLTQFRTVASS